MSTQCGDMATRPYYSVTRVVHKIGIGICASAPLLDICAHLKWLGELVHLPTPRERSIVTCSTTSQVMQGVAEANPLQGMHAIRAYQSHRAGRASK